MVLESFHMGLADGATEVHKVTLARELLKGYARDRRPVPDAATCSRLREEAEARFADVLAAVGR